jgi:hypothetical protein
MAQRATDDYEISGPPGRQRCRGGYRLEVQNGVPYRHSTPVEYTQGNMQKRRARGTENCPHSVYGQVL